MAPSNVEKPATAETVNGLRDDDLVGDLISSYTDTETTSAKQESNGNGFYGADTIKPKRVRRTKAFITEVRDEIKVLRVDEESERETLAKWARLIGGES